MRKMILFAIAFASVANGDATLAASHRAAPPPIYGWPFGPEGPRMPPYPQYGALCDYPRLLRFYGDDVTARLACHGMLFY